MILSNAWIVTMDDAGTEQESGWLRIEDGRIAEIGGSVPPERGEDLGGAVVTPGLVNTHHHLYQTLTRGRAADKILFEWLKELYPVWAGIDAEAPSGDRRTRMVASFNRGYRGFQQTYRTCTPAADLVIRRYLEEGSKIAREVTARYAN